MNVILQATPTDHQGVAEFAGIEGESLYHVAQTHRYGHRRTVLELVFENQLLATWEYASDAPITEVPDFIANHANAYALLLQDNNDYPHLDWIDHTEEGSV